MSVKRVMLSLAATVAAMFAFASPAMAVDGHIAHVTTGSTVSNLTLHLVGNAKFETLGTGIQCTTITSTVELETATTGKVVSFLPEVSTCSGFGSIYAGCKVTSTTTNTPLHVTVTDNDFDVTKTGGETEIEGKLNSCNNSKVNFTNLFFPNATLKPENTAGTTAATGEPIEAVEIVETEGEAENNLGTLAVEATGTLTLTPSERCTYKFE